MSDSMQSGHVEIRFGPRWKYIAATRSYVQNFVAISIPNDSKADQIAMAISELLENAVKYSDGEEIHISMHIDGQAKKVFLSVSNQGNPETVASLRTFFERVHSGPPLETFLELMKEATTRSDGLSQLGLARIRYEVGGEMELHADDNNYVTVSLTVDVDAKENV